MRKNGNSDRLYLLGLQNHCGHWLEPWNLKMLAPWKKSYNKSRQHIIKWKHYFANKSPSSQGYGFSSSHVWMWEVKWSEVTQSCPTLCDPVDCSLPSSSVHGILQAKILEWVAISFSRGSSRPRDWTRVSCIGGRLFNLWATREAHSPWVSTGLFSASVFVNIHS